MARKPRIRPESWAVYGLGKVAEGVVQGFKMRKELEELQAERLMKKQEMDMRMEELKRGRLTANRQTLVSLAEKAAPQYPWLRSPKGEYYQEERPGIISKEDFETAQRQLIAETPELTPFTSLGGKMTNEPRPGTDWEGRDIRFWVNQHLTRSQPYIDMSRVMDYAISNAESEDRSAADRALMFSYIAAVQGKPDPRSISDNDFKYLSGVGGIEGDIFRAAFHYFGKGESLPENVRNQLIGMIRNKYRTAKIEQQLVDQDISNRARLQGLDPRIVLNDVRLPTLDPLKIDIRNPVLVKRAFKYLDEEDRAILENRIKAMVE